MTKPKLNYAVKNGEVHGRDLFQTPNYAVDMLVPFIPKNIIRIWDCAAGDRKITNRLWMKWDYQEVSTDIREGEQVQRFDFLKESFTPFMGAYGIAIITNPPYSLKRQFYNRCREYELPFALLIPADYCGWVIRAVQDDCEKIIPTRRIDYITPNNNENSAAQFHSMWLTWGFRLGRTETFVELSQEMKRLI